ncbi:MAG: phage major capsid protein [Actinobacteria bacterium]|nr:phage major capsid protein [Actinomycetota bacterium]
MSRRTGASPPRLRWQRRAPRPARPGRSPKAATFTKITESVRTIALWVPATTRVVADAPRLRAYIDEYLDADIQTELEDQIVSGDGTGANFTSLLNVAGTHSRRQDGSRAASRRRDARLRH